ncbi:NERD domain-containing protein [Salipaludibacillus sp. LMS25]|uniref:nuclease-related domain-containing protein n=1 Tax=Salipaludibacillus sp. LMS25 TaxID=2924031 RepID=UPI0020D074AC|nr:nuclease-related domain-containing protein [Salipaludibacillus sp. LMS25]UTR13702.1 NERD domain-containing protein [Salipaludibacillus sp. LMS25]
MISKPRTIPVPLLQLESLLRRLPPSHPKSSTVAEMLAKYKKGYRGELALDYYLDYLELDTCFIINDLRLPDGMSRFFQLDTLLLTPAFFCIFEIKNLSGVLSFDLSLNQMRRTIHGETEGYPDPISQVQMQHFHLRRLLNKYGFPQITINPFVVISHPTTIIENRNSSVLHAHAVLTTISELEKETSKHPLQFNMLDEINKKLLELHVPKKWDVLKEFNIDKNELIYGVRCDKCRKYGMRRRYAVWICDFCGYQSKLAHLLALEDYSLLINNVITNKQARTFLKVKSRNVMTYLFKMMTIQMIGKYNYSAYRLPSDYSYSRKGLFQH